jgi:asparagine synthase (glutamine-hydrolysing)
MIIQNGMTKCLLREGMKGCLPEKIRLRRDKIGFGTPQDEWFRTLKWQSLILEILNSNSTLFRDFIDPVKALSLYQNHLAHKTNVSNEIWKWVNLELWFREYIY